mmetsp:Transcript_4926/g.6008  ORF Transcript_4926/g.6008 Transcript_4926/m.6008 type:complete len:96 (+) Transcript_4926:612-899(+)
MENFRLVAGKNISSVEVWMDLCRLCKVLLDSEREYIPMYVKQCEGIARMVQSKPGNVICDFRLEKLKFLPLHNVNTLETNTKTLFGRTSTTCGLI